MITIERMGRPFNVTEQVAAAIEKADLVKDKQELEEQNEQLREELEMAAMAPSEAHDGGAEWSFDSSDGTPVSLAGHTFRLDSDRFDSLYDAGLIGCLQTEKGQYWADSVTLDSLHDSGLVTLDDSGIYMDAKCAGRGWMPGGPGGKCKRVPKGAAKKVKAETAGINRLASGGKKNEARSARIAELRSKLGAKAAVKAEAKRIAAADVRSRVEDNVRESQRSRGSGEIAQLGNLNNFAKERFQVENMARASKGKKQLSQKAFQSAMTKRRNKKNEQRLMEPDNRAAAKSAARNAEKRKKKKLR